MGELHHSGIKHQLSGADRESSFELHVAPLGFQPKGGLQVPGAVLDASLNLISFEM